MNDKIRKNVKNPMVRQQWLRNNKYSHVVDRMIQIIQIRRPVRAIYIY